MDLDTLRGFYNDNDLQSIKEFLQGELLQGKKLPTIYGELASVSGVKLTTARNFFQHRKISLKSLGLNFDGTTIGKIDDSFEPCQPGSAGSLPSDKKIIYEAAAEPTTENITNLNDPQEIKAALSADDITNIINKAIADNLSSIVNNTSLTPIKAHDCPYYTNMPYQTSIRVDKGLWNSFITYAKNQPGVTIRELIDDMVSSYLQQVLK